MDDLIHRLLSLLGAIHLHKAMYVEVKNQEEEYDMIMADLKAIILELKDEQKKGE